MAYVAYAPALHGGFVWDDRAHLSPRAAVYTLHSLRLIWSLPGFTQQYYPLTFSTFWAAHHFFGDQTFGYHVLTLTFHLLNAALVVILLTDLGLPGAPLAGLVFALHPIQVESVAWLSELKNTESTFFYLLALIAFLRFSFFSPRAGWWGAAFFFFLCAMFSKTVSATMPVVALILIAAKRPPRRDDLWALAPFLIVGAALGLQTARWEKQLLGAAGPIWDFSWTQRLQIAAHAFWFYIGKLLWPHPLIFIYPKWDLSRSIGVDALRGLAVAALFAGLWIARKKITNAPWTAALVYATVLFPALGFLNLYPMRYSFVADHFQYVAGIAWIALAAAACARLARRWKMPAALRRMLAFILCVGLASAGRARAAAFRDSLTLWRDTLRKNPRCAMAQGNLGDELLQAGLIAEAAVHIDEAVRLLPNDMNLAMIRGDLELHIRHRPAEAAVWFKRATDVIDALPSSHASQGLRMISHELLGEALFADGRDAEAEIQYRMALAAVAPLRAQLYFDTDPETLAVYEPDIRDHLALLLEKRGRLSDAIDQWEKGLAVAPRHPALLFHLGEALEKSGNVDGARQAFAGAAAASENFWQADEALGRVLSREGRWTPAAAAYQQAVDLEPDRPSLHRALARVWLKLGRPQDAAAELERAER